MEIHHKGYIIKTASESGGKAGTGRNKTSTVQVFKKGGGQMLKHYRFTINDLDSLRSAVDKCKAWVDELLAPINYDSQH